MCGSLPWLQKSSDIWGSGNPGDVLLSVWNDGENHLRSVSVEMGLCGLSQARVQRFSQLSSLGSAVSCSWSIVLLGVIAVIGGGGVFMERCLNVQVKPKWIHVPTNICFSQFNVTFYLPGFHRRLLFTFWEIQALLVNGPHFTSSERKILKWQII